MNVDEKASRTMTTTETVLQSMQLPAPRHTDLLIEGAWRHATGDARFEVRDPATGQLLATVAAASAADVDLAVTSAASAFHTQPWPRLDPAERGAVLFALARSLRAARDEIALLEARDVGKFLEDARGEVDLAASLIEYYAGAADKLGGQTYQAGPQRLAYTLREPIGVVGAIVPWNYPLPLAVLKVAPALAAGNTVVLKPAEEAPLSALALGQLALEAGVPPGVLNVVPGLGHRTGAALVGHPEVRMIAFTGSTEVGKSILRAAADRVARVELELGGKSPQLVFPDADLDAAVAGIRLGLFKNAGQDCCAGSRILVHSAVHDELVQRLVATAEREQLGDPFTTGTTMGPLISPRQRDRVDGYVRGAIEQGARLVTTQGSPASDEAGVSCFYAPTLFDHVDPSTRIFQEEVFGPVGVICEFRDEDDAVRLANSSRYGLASAIWTSDLDTALRVSRQIEAGMVWVNEYYAHVMEMPFGGYKESGIGKDYSMDALSAYTETKEVVIRTH